MILMIIKIKEFSLLQVKTLKLKHCWYSELVYCCHMHNSEELFLKQRQMLFYSIPFRPPYRVPQPPLKACSRELAYLRYKLFYSEENLQKITLLPSPQPHHSLPSQAHIFRSSLIRICIETTM